MKRKSSKIKLSNNSSFFYFNIRNFEISKYRSFYISAFQILTSTLFWFYYRVITPSLPAVWTLNVSWAHWGGGQNLERRNVERPIFRNFKITNIEITKDQLFDSFIFEFIFPLFINYLHILIIFQIVTFNVFFKFFKVLNIPNSLIFQIDQFRIFNNFSNQLITAI